ncbi:MAG: preprotein translocase subunit SecY, partial [bacterium]|nr:preprotein translocase subunit SecY [bacterium]
YLTLGIAIIQSAGLSTVVERYDLATIPGWSFRLLFTISLTVGALFVMWLGEQISLNGIGNGSSMIIFAGIVARFPDDILRVLGSVQQGYVDPIVAGILFLIFIGIASCIVFLERGERKIPVQYTRRIVGQRVYGGQSTYIPFKVNTAGVMPVIFASALLTIPVFISSWLGVYIEIFKKVAESLAHGGLLYSVLEFMLIIAFSFFYTALIFNPEELADNIKKSGAFIPGIRPGKKTAEFFNYILTRLGLIGAIYLGFLAIFPTIVHALFSIPFYISTLSGTALLIMVGVALETAAQIESYLIEHRYEGFLTSGRMRGRRS